MLLDPRFHSRFACLLVASLFAAPAHAVPSAANSHIPAHALLVGRSGGLADTTAGAFTIVVHDQANVPVANSTVELRVLNCPGARVASQAYWPGGSIRCGTHGFLGVTNALGEVRMTLVGGGDPAAPPSGGPCAQVFASNVALGILTLAYLDLDGSSGLGSNDIALWLADFALGEPIGRADFDGDGTIGAGDLSLWLVVWGATGSTESAASYCP